VSPLNKPLKDEQGMPFNFFRPVRVRFDNMKIIVDPKKCRTSGECMLICPENAISILDGVATIDESKCDLDGICIPACPNGAINYSEKE
jgi:Fe-S-cluster-containing hydrogenase component 2